MRSWIIIPLLLLAAMPPTVEAGKVYVINMGSSTKTPPIDLTPNLKQTPQEDTRVRELERQVAELKLQLILAETRLKNANERLAEANEKLADRDTQIADTEPEEPEEPEKPNPKPEDQIKIEPVEVVSIPTKVCQCKGSNRGVCLCLKTGTACQCSSRSGRIYKEQNGKLIPTSKRGHPNRKPKPITVSIPKMAVTLKPPESEATTVEEPKATGNVTTKGSRHYFPAGDGTRWHTDAALRDGVTYGGRFVYDASTNTMTDTRHGTSRASPKPVKVQKVYTGCANGACYAKEPGFFGRLFGN